MAAVVVSYNSGRCLAACLDSLEAEGVERIVVVDNGSSDNSQQIVDARRAEWFESGANVGYGRAANLGASRPGVADAPYILVCNPDLVIQPGAVATLVAGLEADARIGIIGPRLSNPDGTLYPSARTFPDLADAIGHGLFGLVAPNNRFTRRYRLLDWDHSTRRAVDWVSGACFLARRQAWEEVAGFDPAFFMYMEDVDLCWRVGRAGWKVVYEPAAEVVHIQGVSTDQTPYRMLAAHHRAMWAFARRTTSGSKRAFLPLVGVGLAARFVVACGRRRLSGPAGRHLLA